MRIQQFWKEDLARLEKRKRTELEALAAAIREHRDLAQRLDLICSVSGAGLPTAVAILVRMPEIGKITREQAAALAGLAPYDDDSGERVGGRHIAGGRERLRRALYSAALPASFRWNPQLIALYKRLIAAGKRRPPGVQLEHPVTLVGRFSKGDHRARQHDCAFDDGLVAAGTRGGCGEARLMHRCPFRVDADDGVDAGHDLRDVAHIGAAQRNGGLDLLGDRFAAESFHFAAKDLGQPLVRRQFVIGGSVCSIV